MSKQYIYDSQALHTSEDDASFSWAILSRNCSNMTSIGAFSFLRRFLTWVTKWTFPRPFFLRFL